MSFYPIFRITFCFCVSQLYLSKTRQSGLTDNLHQDLLRTVNPTARQQGKSRRLFIFFSLVFFLEWCFSLSNFFGIADCETALNFRPRLKKISSPTTASFFYCFLVSLEFARNFRHSRIHAHTERCRLTVLTTRYSLRTYIETGEVLCRNTSDISKLWPISRVLA